MNRLILALLISPLLMAILPVKYPCALTIIAIGAPPVLLVVADHGVCYKIFGIWNNRLLSDPFWKLVCGILLWVPTRANSLWPEFFLYMARLATLVTSHIWLDRWPSSSATSISTMKDLEFNLLQILVDQLINFRSVCIWKWRLFLILLLSNRQFSLLWINNITVFNHSLLYKGLIGDELLYFYDIHITYTKFLDKIRNLLVLLNFPKKKSWVRSILKNSNYVP